VVTHGGRKNYDRLADDRLNYRRRDHERAPLQPTPYNRLSYGC